MTEIQELLFSERDPAYADFQSKIIPNVDKDFFIGVRTPIIHALAKTVSVSDSCEAFLSDLPHRYFDENQLHICIISGIKDFDKCIERIEAFLPYIDNWATCDMLSPRVFAKNKARLLPYIEKWMRSPLTYTVRFGVQMLMNHYLGDDFDEKYLHLVTSLRSDEYYVNMQIAWFMAEALAKQWDSAILFLESYTMDKFVHNKTIQKAIESRKISEEKKSYLRTLKIR